MGFHRSKVDLVFSDSGDYILDEIRGDLLDTTSLNYRALIQQITTRLESSKGDWRLQNGIGANISRFRGRTNNKQLGQEIQTSVENALLFGGFLKKSEFVVEVFPISNTNIAISLSVKPSGEIQKILINFTYDTKDNKLTPRNI